ncbi:indolepyruvate ferredoxin oxidoreductase beta subunit IorB [Methanobrevibacter ruminantium M1]|uniref:Indolepyruvate ferredoxin oxidoreductase subunit beta n=1 Tax=Methanobrevibacter ruminantium (strain ATCC 35063 / DSM 1093 / JCM 13430 / OCM 146 / M1) TaxID=634498 RepID=D3E1U7_METRM|nr:indolepyruvate oxidoreductase subunit beta [Methanobrevibacter ruminantium]ADC46508.1 indolepyruvate ferredoxin oxidoreductase beta subunit IorB [Methanobrevibacter ruminantium M1]
MDNINSSSSNSDNSDVNYSIYISGVGGQGIIKTSVIIGEAAMLEGYDVVMSEIHGMSQRGGSVSTELKIGNFKSSIVEENKADLILAFEPIEVLRGLDKANKDTALIFNTFPIVPSTLTQTGETYPDIGDIIKNLKDNFDSVYPVEGNGLAKDAGSILSLNMVLLGACVANDSFPLSKETVETAMKHNLAPKFHEMNLKAIENGYNAIKDSL